MDRDAWQATVHGTHRVGHDRAHTHTHIHTPILSKHFNDFYKCTHFKNVHAPHTNVHILQMYMSLTQMYTFSKCIHPSNSNQGTENI